MMPIQRARIAENRARNKLSNGPRRVQSNVLQESGRKDFLHTEYSATYRHTSVAEDMSVSG